MSNVVYFSSDAALNDARKLLHNWHDFTDDEVITACNVCEAWGNWLDIKEASHIRTMIARTELQDEHDWQNDAMKWVGYALIAFAAVALILAVSQAPAKTRYEMHVQSKIVEAGK